MAIQSYSLCCSNPKAKDRIRASHNYGDVQRNTSLNGLNYDRCLLIKSKSINSIWKPIEPYVLADLYSWLEAHSGLSHPFATTTASTIGANTSSLDTNTTSPSSSSSTRGD
jgi:hypothetical protein